MIKVIKKILPKDRIYHVAVSMGVDSVAALVFLRSKGYKVIPIHFNHNMRAQNYDMMDRFHTFCDHLNLVGHCHIGIDLNTEAGCRDARLEFYKTVAKNGTVVTAHHLNDWVESYLLNCLRGHPNHNSFELVSDFDSFCINHPFLLSKKTDFIEYLDRHDLMKYTVEDETNDQTKGSRRNWIRNYLIPEMQTKKLSLEKFAKRHIIKLIEEISVQTI